MKIDIKELENILKPLLKIANSYDANNLDDDARKFWGKNLENENRRNPEKIELYTGRGGSKLLTLDDCLKARTFFEMLKGKNES